MTPSRSRSAPIRSGASDATRGSGGRGGWRGCPRMEKSDVALPPRRPPAKAANFDPSGWYAAVPRPETTTNMSTTPYEGETDASAMPAPATATPRGSSQMAPRRSDQRPNTGWTTDDEIADASIAAAASVYERSNLSTQN